MDREEALSKIIPMNEALWFMPAFEADIDMVKKIAFGQNPGLENKISPPKDGQEPFVKIVAPDGSVAAVVEYDAPLDRYNYCCVFVA